MKCPGPDGRRDHSLVTREGAERIVLKLENVTSGLCFKALVMWERLIDI